MTTPGLLAWPFIKVSRFGKKIKPENSLSKKEKIFFINYYDLEGLLHFKIKNYKHWFYLNLALESNFHFYQSLLLLLYGQRTFNEEIWIDEIFYKNSYCKNMLAQAQAQLL